MDVAIAFAREHVPEITGTVGLVTYALLRNKLTIPGIFSGILVAGVHMLHPWKAFFWLLIIFFVLGTLVTRVSTLRPHLHVGRRSSMGMKASRIVSDVVIKESLRCAQEVLPLTDTVLLDWTQSQAAFDTIIPRRCWRRGRPKLCASVCQLWFRIGSDIAACVSPQVI